jgi:uncharacterized protein YwgA
MFDSAYRLLKLFASSAPIKGRKKLQKMVYLMSVAGAPFQYKYRYHHFGPYSEQLQAEINELVQKGYVSEKNEDSAYVYTLTDKGKMLMERLEQEEGYSCTIDARLTESLARQTSTFLEMVSTYAFLVQSGDEPERARQKAVELKGHLADMIDEAISYYEQIRWKNAG